jgi:hypothetical protein
MPPRPGAARSATDPAVVRHFLNRIRRRLQMMFGGRDSARMLSGDEPWWSDAGTTGGQYYDEGQPPH